MSYCRWSTDRFACDLYCYADVRGGYTTHVAGNRIVGDCPPDMFELMADAARDGKEVDHSALMEAEWKKDAFLDNCERVDIDLPHAGETFNDPDLTSFRVRLVMLREAGYRFPDSVLAEIDEEMAEIDAARVS